MINDLTVRLTPLLKNLLFDELSPEYCNANGLEFLVGVPIPFKPQDLTDFANEGLEVTKIADNMAMVIGADPDFSFRNKYVQFFNKFFSNGLTQVLLGKSTEALQEQDFKRAAIYVRAAKLLDEENADVIFLFGCVMREWYLSLEGDENQVLVATLKGLANNHFEQTVSLDPTYASAWYYLGFTYLNQGLYLKAKLAWEKFLKNKNQKDESTEEITERLEELAEPVKIEEGINHMLAGRLEEGLRILEPYTETEYNDWWPLHYYLASAYRAMGHEEEAVEGFRKVLALSPSHYESCKALYEIFAAAGNQEQADKYLKKSEIILNNSKN